MIKDSMKIHETFHTSDDGELLINGQGIPVQENETVLMADIHGNLSVLDIIK